MTFINILECLLFRAAVHVGFLITFWTSPRGYLNWTGQLRPGIITHVGCLSSESNQRGPSAQESPPLSSAFAGFAINCELVRSAVQYSIAQSLRAEEEERHGNLRDECNLLATRTPSISTLRFSLEELHFNSRTAQQPSRGRGRCPAQRGCTIEERRG